MTTEKDYFKTFCKISKAFGTTLGKEKLLELIVQSAIDTMNAKAACLFLSDKAKDVFIPVAQKGLSDNYLHASPMQARKIVDEILKGGYLSFYDATTDPRLENLEAKKAEGIASILSVPVMVKDQAIGVLFFKGDQPLTVDDLYYSLNVGGLVIGEVTVAENETVSGPDFNIQMESVQSGIQGTVTFTGAWPAPAEEVRLVAATTFPPTFEEIIIGDSIPVDAASYDYLFELRPDTYRIVGVAWRAEGTNWDILSICGFYFSGEDSLAPGQVVVPTDVSVVDNINIEVDRSKARKITDTKIVGSITFNGTWPADVTEARVIATTRFSILPPNVELPTLLDLAFSDVIQPGITSLDYVIKAFPGTFVATGVIFFREGQTLSVGDIFYSAEVGGLDVNPYEVPEDSTVAGPDFNIQF